MSASRPDPATGALHALVAGAARACGAAASDLVCRDRAVMQPAPGDLVEIASVPVTWGRQVCRLRLLDRHPREIDAPTLKALMAIGVAVETYLSTASDKWPNDQPVCGVKVGAALEYMTDAVILLHQDWTIEYVNVAFERAAGFRRETLIGHSYWDSFPNILGTDFETQVREAMASRFPRIFEEFSTKLNKWYECRAFPCQQGLVILFIDITMRKADELTRVDLEEKLVRIQRMESLGTLAGGVAHDFNNILAAILGHAGMMLSELPPASPLRPHMQQIKRAGDRARELVQRILAYARGSGHELSKHQLKPLVQESIELLRATLPSTVKLSVDLGDDACVATVNPSEVQQVVMNLCTNAWQAMRGGRGHLRITLRCVAFDVPRAFLVGRVAPIHYAELCVEDDGHGMAPDVLERLFEPFFTTKPRGQGTGLGLHVVNGIVHAHGGAIDVKTVAGSGTRFAIYLPVVDQQVPLAPAQLLKVAEPGNGEPVIYVDDDPIVLMMVEALLSKAGYAVTVFGDPQACLRAIEQGDVDPRLLVTDFNMPGMDGMELTIAVRGTRPRLPVIITTGYISDELTAAAARLGHVAVLQKERSFEELVELAARALCGFPESRFVDTGLSPL